MRAAIQLPAPAYPHSAAIIRKRTVLRGVRGELVKHDCYWLYRIRSHAYSWAFDQCIAIPHTGGQFSANELTNRNSMPSIDAQKRMRFSQRSDTSSERFEEIVERIAAG